MLATLTHETPAYSSQADLLHERHQVVKEIDVLVRNIVAETLVVEVGVTVTVNDPIFERGPDVDELGHDFLRDDSSPEEKSSVFPLVSRGKIPCKRW